MKIFGYLSQRVAWGWACVSLCVGGKLKTRLQRGNWIIMSLAWCSYPNGQQAAVVTWFWAAFHALPKRFRFRWQSQQQLCVDTHIAPIFFWRTEKFSRSPRSVDISETGQNRNFATGVIQLSLAVQPATNILQPGQISRKHVATPQFHSARALLSKIITRNNCKQYITNLLHTRAQSNFYLNQSLLIF